MNKRLSIIFSVLVILAFIGYIVIDTSRPENREKTEIRNTLIENIPDKWRVSDVLAITDGSLKAVTVSKDGILYAGGTSFVNSFDQGMKIRWRLKTPEPITALCTSGDTVYAATLSLILVIGKEGKIIEEWGPFEDNSLITSITVNDGHVAYADAGNKMIVILDREGRVERILGQNDGQFVIPSPYFDVALDSSGDLYIANTGHRRIETRTITGQITGMFGEPGLAPEAFCGCCNPASFALIPDGFVTAEKGINRIKILDRNGKFVEFVSSDNKFLPSVPLDISTADGQVIFAANPADSKIYRFIRK